MEPSDIHLLKSSNLLAFFRDSTKRSNLQERTILSANPTRIFIYIINTPQVFVISPPIRELLKIVRWVCIKILSLCWFHPYLLFYMAQMNPNQFYQILQYFWKSSMYDNIISLGFTSTWVPSITTHPGKCAFNMLLEDNCKLVRICMFRTQYRSHRFICQVNVSLV